MSTDRIAYLSLPPGMQVPACVPREPCAGCGATVGRHTTNDFGYVTVRLLDLSDATEHRCPSPQRAS